MKCFEVTVFKSKSVMLTTFLLCIFLFLNACQQTSSDFRVSEKTSRLEQDKIQSTKTKKVTNTGKTLAEISNAAKNMAETEEGQLSNSKTSTSTAELSTTNSIPKQISNYAEQEAIINETEQATLNIENNCTLIVIDPGHQSIYNSGREPLGPGSYETKANMTYGTSGVTTGIPEYQLNLDVSLLLEEELIKRGYNVELTRRSNEVDLTNIDRTEIANNLDADAYVRIHANGSNNPHASGMMTICQTANNPYNSHIAAQCKLLSTYILDAMVSSTGAVKEYVWETDTMSGINWSNVPVTIVEMGYMTNPEEDLKLADPNYQIKIVDGIANGIDQFFGF